MQSFDVRVGEIVRYAITERVFPGAVLAVLKNGNFAYEQCFGHFTYDQESPDVLKNTVYDIASLTKQIVATGALILFDRGDIHLEDTINLFLPELAGSSIGNVTIFNLLTHTSGINIQTSKFRVDELGSLLSGILPQLDVHDSGQVQYANIFIFIGEIVSRISFVFIRFSPKRFCTAWHEFDFLLKKIYNQLFRQQRFP
jgi:CubicO group peptidase (beta-lactamase class C family)